MIYEHRGQQFGTRLENRGTKDNHIRVRLMGEDDGHWFDIGNGFSSHWLNDLIEVLQITRDNLSKNFRKDPSGFGYIDKRRIK